MNNKGISNSFLITKVYHQLPSKKSPTKYGEFRPHSYQQSEGAKFELHFEKTRSFYGDAAEPVGLAHTIIDGISIWDMFTITNEREEEVVKLYKQGMKQIEIAETLNINQSTVSKLLASSRAKGLL